MATKHHVVTAIRRYNAGLDPERLRLKLALMREDAFAFFRGTCHLFYQRLPPLGSLAHAPAAWCCGDLHLENFGSFKGDNGLVYFDLNDFDEAVLAPCVWDLIRLVASIRVARKTLGVTAKEASRLAAELIDAYATALAHGKANWLERDEARGEIGAALSELKGRSRREFLERRTVITDDQRRIVIDGVHSLAADDRDRKLVRKLLGRFARNQDDPKFFRPIDVARRIAGTGSLGLQRYVILVAGKGGLDHMHLLDLKQARASSSPRHLDVKQPKWSSEAARVVTVQMQCQAVSPAHLTAVETHKRSFVLRDLQPLEDRFDLARIGRNPDELGIVMRAMGSLLAFDQLRASGRRGAAVADDLVAFAAKPKWRSKLLDVAAEAGDRAYADWNIYVESVDHKSLRSNTAKRQSAA